MISRRINPPIVRHSHNWLAALTAIIISLYTLFFKVSLVKVKAFNGFFFYFFSLPLYIMLFFFFFFSFNNNGTRDYLNVYRFFAFLR